MATWMQRFKFEQDVRNYFLAQGFIEVRTPLLVKSPGMEPDIFPLEVAAPHLKEKVFLPTSPEFGMKKLLAQAPQLDSPMKIFQICSSFRNEPESPEHQPEFTMLEFYETQISLSDLQSRIESLFLSLLQSRNAHESSNTNLLFRGHTLNLQTPWPRKTVRSLFEELCQIDLRTADISTLERYCKDHHISVPSDATWDDLYFLIWLNHIEPKLPKDRPFFITDFPLHQSSLCNSIADETGFLWANRFEVFLGGLELGNAFDELRDPKKQRSNFEQDQKKRIERYGNTRPTSPIDEEFLNAVKRLPPTCGIALGLDRMAMIFLNENSIEAVTPLKTFW